MSGVVLSASLALLLGLHAVTVGGQNNCSIGDLPTSIDWLMSYVGASEGATLLLLSEPGCACNGSVNVWRFCLSLNVSGVSFGEMAELGNITFGIWRPEANGTFYKQIILEVFRPSPNFPPLDIFCQRIGANKTVDIDVGDVLGVVSYGRPSVLNMLAAEESNGSECVGEVSGENVSCSTFRYNFYLQGYQDERYMEPTVSPVECDVMGTATTTTTTEALWLYAVVAILLFLLIVAILIIVVILVRLRTLRQLRKFDVSMTKPSSPRYVERSGVEILENKIPRDNECDADLSSCRESCGSTNESTHAGAVQDETSTPILSSMFSYPPPASRAPLPPLETSISSVHDNMILEMNVRGLSEEQNEVREKRDEAVENGVPHYPLKISTSVPVIRSASLEEDKEPDENSLYDNDVFEVKPSRPSRGCSTPPVPAPRKATPRKTMSNKLPPGNNSVILNLYTDERQKGTKKEEEGIKVKMPSPDYVNVKHNVGRLKSAPVTSDTPVYAEPMVTNQRTRIMSYNPGISKTPPLSSGRKMLSTRQRSVSGGDSSPLSLARVFPNLPRSLDGSVSSNPGLDKIVENDEVLQDCTVPRPELQSQPGEYLEPVPKKK